jgi:hypothetical protein
LPSSAAAVVALVIEKDADPRDSGVLDDHKEYYYLWWRSKVGVEWGVRWGQELSHTYAGVLCACMLWEQM